MYHCMQALHWMKHYTVKVWEIERRYPHNEDIADCRLVSKYVTALCTGRTFTKELHIRYTSAHLEETSTLVHLSNPVRSKVHCIRTLQTGLDCDVTQDQKVIGHECNVATSGFYCAIVFSCDNTATSVVRKEHQQRLLEFTASFILYIRIIRKNDEQKLIFSH